MIFKENSEEKNVMSSGFTGKSYLIRPKKRCIGKQSRNEAISECLLARMAKAKFRGMS